MASVVTINRSDVVSLIEAVASRLMGGNKTEAIALGMRRLLEEQAKARQFPLFGAHRGSVRVKSGIDLTEPVFDIVLDAESGKEVDH